MPANKGLYHNKMKTPAKVNARIALDLIKANELKQSRFNSNSYVSTAPTTPDPPVTSDHNILSLTHLDSNPAAVVQGDMIVGDKTPEWSRLPIGGVDEVLTSDGTTAAWAAPAAPAAHDLLSATHGDSNPQAVTRGSIIVGNFTPDWDELAIGANGTVLTSDGTDAAWAPPVSSIQHTAETTVSVGGAAPTLIDTGVAVSSGAIAWVTGRTTNSGVHFNVLSSPMPVADTCTYYWYENGAGDLEIAVVNDTQRDIKAIVHFVIF